MNRVNIVARITHSQPISLTLLQVKCGRSWLMCHWIRHAIDGPAVEAFFGSIVFRECHLESLVSKGSRHSWFSKTGIAPLQRGRSSPLCLAGSPRVLHHNSHTVSAITVIEITQNPDARMIHVN